MYRAGQEISHKNPITVNQSVVYFGQERISEHTINVEKTGPGHVEGSDIFVWSIILKR